MAWSFKAQKPDFQKLERICLDAWEALSKSETSPIYVWKKVRAGDELEPGTSPAGGSGNCLLGHKVETSIHLEKKLSEKELGYIKYILEKSVVPDTTPQVVSENEQKEFIRDLIAQQKLDEFLKSTDFADVVLTQVVDAKLTQQSNLLSINLGIVRIGSHENLLPHYQKDLHDWVVSQIKRTCRDLQSPQR